MTEQSPAEAIFFAALDLGSPEERAAYLGAACGEDRDLRQRVERLLAAHPQVGNFLETPNSSRTISWQAPAEAVGSVIAGRYKLLEVIGEGGMGTVFMAQQTEPVKRLVALKVIKPGLDSKQVLTRFEAERQALALMDHPNVAKVFDGGISDLGRPFFVMELVKGVPITKFCDARKLTPRGRLELFVPVCLAIQHAHTKGIIHRDIKPSNVLVSLHDGRPAPKVIDFGVAKAAGQPLTEATLVTGFGTVIGTPEYMSPEQAELNQLDIDTRSDVYSLGVLLYELLTGTTPIDRKRLGSAALLEVLRVVREEEPLRPSNRISTSEALPSIAAARQTEPVKLTGLMRGDLDWIVMKALEKDRGRRYETANGFAEDVKHYLSGEPVSAAPPTPGYRLKKFVQRHKARTAAAATIAALVMLAIGLAVSFAWWSDRQAAERRHERELIATRSNDALAATLDRVENALRTQRRLEAAALLRQIEAQPDARWPAELRDRLDRLRLDERTVRELEEIFEERWMVLSTETRMYNERAKRRYPQLFQSYGLKVGSTPAKTIIEKIRNSVISDVLVSSLADWFFVEPEYPGLAAFLDLLDPDPLRAKIRAEVLKGNPERIEALGKEIDGSQLSPAYAIGLSNAGGGASILKAAWPAHPDSFPLALTICGFTCSTNNEEAVGWGRMAVSLRPNNALAHYFYALSSFYIESKDGERDKSDRATTAIPELRQTIKLAPRFARAHGWLAFLLRYYGRSEQERNSEAIALANKAIELDDSNDLGRVVVLMEQMNDKKYIDAAREYWRLKSYRDDDKLAIINEDYGSGVTLGCLLATRGALFFGLAESGWPLEAYRLIEDRDPTTIEAFESTEGEEDRYYFQAARVAALAGCGQGNDAPPESERPAIRKQAFAWLKDRLEACRQKPDDAVDSRKAVHDEMNRWLGDAGFAAVRDDSGLGKLPDDEQRQWRKLWAEVHSLSDKTASAATTPKKEN